ncbi:MAG: hypothetical protein AB1776_00210 [Bacillota bacterium]
MLPLILLIVAGFAAIVAFELPRLLREKLYREMTVFFVLIAIGLALSIGQVLRVPLPNITKGIEAATRPVYKMIEKALAPRGE